VKANELRKDNHNIRKWLTGTLEGKKDLWGRFHQRFSRAFLVRLIQNVTRKKAFVRKTRAKNVGEIDLWRKKLRPKTIVSDQLARTLFIFLEEKVKNYNPYLSVILRNY